MYGQRTVHVSDSLSFPFMPQLPSLALSLAVAIANKYNQFSNKIGERTKKRIQKQEPDQHQFILDRLCMNTQQTSFPRSRFQIKNGDNEESWKHYPDEQLHKTEDLQKASTILPTRSWQRSKIQKGHSPHTQEGTKESRNVCRESDC